MTSRFAHPVPWRRNIAVRGTLGGDMTDEYLEQMQAHLNAGGVLSHRNGLSTPG